MSQKEPSKENKYIYLDISLPRRVGNTVFIDKDLSSPVDFRERKTNQEIYLFGQPLGLFQATLGSEFMGLPVEDQDTILGMLSTLSPKGRDLADRLVFLLVEEEKKEAETL